jgi:outer membrane protein assembly factor BamB
MKTLKVFVVLLALRANACLAQDVLTYHNDNGRTGQNLNETNLNPSNVNVNTFGKLFVLPADGKVDAQPLYVSNLPMDTGIHNVVFVATEHDSVYAYDADTGALLWRVTVFKAGETPSDDRACGQVTPEIGVTATPVIDRSSGPHGTIYVVAMSKDSSGNYHQRLHALDITTGAEEFGGPVAIEATYPGTGDEGNRTTLTFDPKQHKARASLLLLSNTVYVAWSSHCDHDPYTAWIMGYNESTLVQTRLLNITPNGSEGSVWQSGAGPAADSGGNIYFLTANGTADTTLNAQGFPISGDYGNAFMKLSTDGNALAVADYFNMFNTVAESSVDADLGSGGALVLPDMTDSNNMTWHLAVGAGKDRNIYLVNRDDMGQFNLDTNRIYQQLTTPLSGEEFGMAAYFKGAIYYGAVADHLKMFPFSNAKLIGPSSQTVTRFQYPGTTPSVSANGTTNAIVWAAENTDPAVLHAYDAANLATEFYNSNQAANGRDQFGTGNKFITPMIANGKVYVGTTSGVGVFGLTTTIITPKKRQGQLTSQ